jgi:hypothetical protein
LQEEKELVMDKSKETVENVLNELLDDCLGSMNQDGTIQKLDFDPKTETVTVTLSTHFVEDDNYIGFAGY